MSPQRLTAILCLMLLAASIPARLVAQRQPDNLFDIPVAKNPRVLAAVPAESRHPVLAELQLATALEDYDGSQQAADFELVVVHPSQARGGVDDVPLVLDAIAAGAGILVLDADETHKAVLRRHTGLSTDGDSLAYFFDLTQDRHAEIFDLPRSVPPTEEEFEAVPVDPAFAPAAEAFQSAFREAPLPSSSTADEPEVAASFVSDVLTFLARSRVPDPEASNDNPLPPFPPELKKWTSRLHVTQSKDLPHGQTAVVSFNFIVAALLNNPPDGESFEFIYVQSNGIVVPGKMAHNSAYHKGWFQRKFDIYLEPKDAPYVVWSQSSPKNTAKVRQVTDRMNFNIAFDKGGGRSLFDFKSESTREIAEWEILEKTQGQRAEWTYAQRDPYNGTRRACCAGASRDCAMDFWDKVKSPPVLSKHTMQVSTQALWRTTRVFKKEVQFELELEQTLANNHSHVIYHRCHAKKNKLRKGFTVDLNKIR